jgi:hypothetical protein
MTDAKNVVNYGTALNKYVKDNPGDYGLTGWAAAVPKPMLPPPPGKHAGELPPPSIANLGMTAYDADNPGVKYINRTGSKWELVQ